MGITIAWDDAERTTLIYTIDGRWTWDEFYNTIYQAREMMENVPHAQVHSIVDISNGKLFPANALSHFARMSTARHPKTGMMVMVGMGSFVRALMNMLNGYKQHSTNRIRVAQTLDEARSILAELGSDETGVT
jgi:hypothetical protein